MALKPIEFTFDIGGIEPYVSGGEPLPTGTYAMKITDMQVKGNNGDTGSNLALEYTVLEGEFKGRKFFENLNLWHKTSSSAVEIAYKQLSSIGHALGITAGSDLTILADKAMLVDLQYVDATPDTPNPNTGETIKGRGPQNRVSKRSAYAAQSIQKQPGFQQQQQASAANQAPPMQQQAPQQQVPNPVPQQQSPAPQQVAQGTPGAAPPPWQRG